MDKPEWRRSLAYLFDEHLTPHLPRWRRRPRDFWEERYLLERLARAVAVMRFEARHPGIVERRALAQQIDAVESAGGWVAELDESSGVAAVLAEHRRLIASELALDDLPSHDHAFLEEADVPDPELELALGIQRLKERATEPLSADERGTYRGAVDIARRRAEQIKEEIQAEAAEGGEGRPPNRPPRRPFKGLGGVGKGFGLVIADTLVLVEWPVMAPEAAKAGALASFALGWDGILSGLGDLRGE